jgi:hypoxanthine-guanine phosphoribosyltransferase
MTLHQVTRTSWRIEDETDFGDDLIYSAESVREELKAVLRNVTRARNGDKQTALSILIGAKALLNDAITECEP